MRKFSVLVFIGACSWPCVVFGADESLDIEALKRELRDLRQRTEQLERKLLLLEETTNTLPKTNIVGGTAELASQPSPAGTEPPDATKSWSPTDPLTIFRNGRSYMNIGFDALMNAGWSTASEPSEELNLGDHDPLQRGFSIRSTELVLEGAVDPYFTGFADFVFKLDKDNETEIEAEEIYGKTSSLPWNLQLKGGHFFANFGRHNILHPHQWAFVDQPLAANRMLGPEGMRNIGAELSWLAPTPFFTELSLGVFNGNSEQAFLFRNPGEDDGTGVNRFRGRSTLDRNLRGPGDLLFVPRISSSFEVTETQTVLVGTSGAFGQNETGQHMETQIYGADIFWKWKPLRAEKGFPFVAWQTEGLLSRFEASEDIGAGLPESVLYDYGFYSQALWGFRPRWVAALRGEWVDGDFDPNDLNDVFRGQRTRVSPNLTWYPTEFSKIRLQYNFDRGERFANEHSVWLQFEFQLGAHSPHNF